MLCRRELFSRCCRASRTQHLNRVGVALAAHAFAGLRYVSTATNSSQSIFASYNKLDHALKEIPDASKSITPRSRQSMTAREISAFDEMFDMIFDAIAENKGNYDASQADTDAKVQGLQDILGKLRRQSKRVRWTSELDQALDNMREQVDMCQSDRELLDWALREVFAQEEAQEEDALQTSPKHESDGPKTRNYLMLRHPTYSHAVSLLMRTFRDKYHDPHLALAIFNYTKNLSVASYVFGCSTQAYNELIMTLWSCFHDLKGIRDTLLEMARNGVKSDSQTLKVIDSLRAEVRQSNIWVDDTDSEEDALNLVTEIEQALGHVTSPGDRRPRVKKWNEWKSHTLPDVDDDQWGFNRWELGGSPSENSDVSTLS